MRVPIQNWTSCQSIDIRYMLKSCKAANARADSILLLTRFISVSLGQGLGIFYRIDTYI